MTEGKVIKMGMKTRTRMRIEVEEKGVAALKGEEGIKKRRGFYRASFTCKTGWSTICSSGIIVGDGISR
jgi:hypothetical protein